MPARKKSAAKQSAPDQSLRKHLVELLKGGGAHISFAEGLEDFPADQRGAFAPGLPHTGWQLLEHARIAQRDILEFSRNPRHVSPEFPDGNSRARRPTASWQSIRRQRRYAARTPVFALSADWKRGHSTK